MERSSDKPEPSVARAQICVTPSGENLFDKLNPVTRSALLASRIFFNVFFFKLNFPVQFTLSIKIKIALF